MSIAPSPEPPPLGAPDSIPSTGLTPSQTWPVDAVPTATAGPRWPEAPLAPAPAPRGPETAAAAALGPHESAGSAAAVTAPRGPGAVPEVKRPARRDGVLGGLILIALGLAALGGNWFPASGAWLFLGLGGAFLIARVLTGRRGYAVPAGLLLAFGSFVWLTETGAVADSGAGGLFFVLLGLGFLAVFAIAARPESVWPIVPGAMLIAFGGFLQGALFGVPVDRFWWLAPYWPVSLLALGAWLLMRDRLPAPVRRLIAILGASALILIGLLVAAAGLGTLGGPYARTGLPMPWPPLFQGMPPFGNPPLVDTITVATPGVKMPSD